LLHRSFSDKLLAMLKPIRLLAFLGLFAATLLFVTGCSTDENDSITGQRDPAAEGAPDVPGAATPAPNAHSAGWW
jgi:hypothetical protein